MSSSSTGSTAPSDPATVAANDPATVAANDPASVTASDAASVKAKVSNLANAANAIQPAPVCSLPLNLHQGDTISLPDDGSIRLPRTSANEESLYQVIALDAGHDRCWIRSWPLTRQGSPVFEISLQQAQRHGAQRPVLQRQAP